MIVKLIVVKGQDEGKIFYVRPDASKVVGRSTKTDIPLRDVGVSRLHCEVRNDGEQAVLVDMNSKNGSSINGQRISGIYVLKDRDRIGVGATVLEARMEGADETADLAAAPAEAPEPVPPGFGAEPEAPAEGDDALLPPFGFDAAPTASEEHPPLPQQDEEEVSPEELLGSFDAWLEEGAAPKAPPGEPEELEEFSDLAKPEAPPAPSSAPSGTPAPSAGMCIGGCRLDEAAGRDDLCLVFRGVQVSMDRPVVVKILDPRVTGDERAVERFLRAARAGGRLSHPNIVQVYDAGEEQGYNFIVLEHVEGESVQALMKREGRGKPLALRRSLDIADQILGALEYAHGESVVHRNIKLDNIYVTRHGVAKLADLGFAKRLSPGDTGGTRHGETLGDIFFAAPEQLVDAASAGPQADLYSMGMVLFVMLTGRLPFPSNDRAQVLERIRQGRLKAIRKLNPSLPDAVADAVEKALRPGMAERFQNAAEMREALSQAAP